MGNYSRLIGEIRDEFPSFKIQYKRSSRLMRVIGFLLKVISFGKIRSFFTDYVTTIGANVYVPDGWKDMGTDTKCIILRHERVHMRQCRRLTLPLFAILYLFLPFPTVFAYFRSKFEMEAYEETIVAIYETHGLNRILSDEFKKFILEQFSSSSYMWMGSGMTSVIENWFYGVVRELQEKDRLK